MPQDYKRVLAAIKKAQETGAVRRGSRHGELAHRLGHAWVR